jgi:hypothetical protein
VRSSGIQRASHAMREFRKSMARERARRKKRLKWWLVYGPPRAGTTYMHRMVKTCAALHVSDWGLAPALAPLPEWLRYSSAQDFDYIRFDYNRFLKDISRNILDNAYLGNGTQLDLAYKQATLGPSEYDVLVRMWGPPERTIFCIREPAGYMASARKKFVYDTIGRLQAVYVDSIDSYLEIRGDVFDYTPDSSITEYISFLRPLHFDGQELPPFDFRGEQDHENATEEMWNAYLRIKDLAAS